MMKGIKAKQPNEPKWAGYIIYVNQREGCYGEKQT